jgi:hypothetical protein
MNTDTGRIYRGFDEMQAALARGEPLVEVSEEVARTMEAGQRVSAYKQRRIALAKKRRDKRAAKRTH